MLSHHSWPGCRRGALGYSWPRRPPSVFSSDHRRVRLWESRRACWISISLIFFAVLGADLWTPATTFAVTRHYPWDKFLGDLCYPIYLVHVTVIIWVRTSTRRPSGLSTRQLWLIDGLVVIVALIIYAVCDRPMDGLRKRRFSRMMSSEAAISDERPRTLPLNGYKGCWRCFTAPAVR